MPVDATARAARGVADLANLLRRPTDADVWVLEANAPGADVAGANFANLDVAWANFASAAFAGANFDSADFVGTVVAGADVAGDVAGADVAGDVPSADVSGIDAAGADVAGSNVAGADAAGVVVVAGGTAGVIIGVTVKSDIFITLPTSSIASGLLAPSNDFTDGELLADSIIITILLARLTHLAQNLNHSEPNSPALKFFLLKILFFFFLLQRKTTNTKSFLPLLTFYI